jgi:hypothetical protein
MAVVLVSLIVAAMVIITTYIGTKDRSA